MNNNKKYELFLEICDFYDYKVSEENEKIICRHDEENYFEYKDIDEALCDWYNTLMDSNENHEEYNEVNRYTVWSKEEIDFIRCLIRDKALDVVASYNIILDIPIKNIEIKNCFDVIITSEKEGKTTVNKMDDYCRIFIDEINTLIDVEHDENKKTSLINMRNIMLDYKYMIKEYRAELVAIGKYVRDEIKDREFYNYVNWEEFNEDVYANIGYNMSKHKENMQQLIDYSLEKVDHYSDWTFDLIVKYVDDEVENEGYVFDCFKERFVKEKTIKGLVKLLEDNNIKYSLIKDKLVYVDLNKEDDYVEISMDDIGLEYSVVVGLNRKVSENNSNLTKYWLVDDNALVDFLNEHIGKVKELCDNCKKEVFLEDKYDLQECPNCGERILPYDSKEKIVIEKIHDVFNVNELDFDEYDFQMDFDFENSDMINNYLMDKMLGCHFIWCIVHKEDGAFDIDNCKIGMIWYSNDSDCKYFHFTDEQIRTIKDKIIKEIKDNNMGEVKDSENKAKECEVNNMNALQVKYDIDLKYKGTEFVGVLECHKIECKGIPCVKDDKLELVNALYSQKGCENYIVKFIEINNIIYPISDIRYWYGINTDELFEQIDYLIREKETPREYIKTSYKTYKIENFDDVLEANLEGCIEEFYIEDEVLSNVVQKYMGCDVEFLVSDLNTLLEDINNDMDALESVLGENPKLSYWLNSEVYCYPNCNLDEAYERYLEEEEEIPFKAIDYIDINDFIKNETDLRELELNNCTILYC